MYVPGVSGSNCRSRIRGILPLYALLQIFAGLREERYAVKETGCHTGGGHQSPTIIAITDPKYRREIAKLNAEVMGSNTDPYYGAPVVILVLADGSASTFVEDGSCVLENMMLAAHALGLGTVWVHREREIFDSESGKALLREWKLPETLRGVGAVALGYPAREASQPAARKQNYIVRI